MAELTIKEARNIYHNSDALKSLMLTKFSKKILEADDSSDSDKSSHLKDLMGNELWYDADGNMIHTKYPNGSEKWYEYDSYGNRHLIHYTASDGFEWWYDANGKLIYTKNSNGSEHWFDDSGKPIRYKDADGYEKWYERDSLGNTIHEKNSRGSEWWNEYDANGNCIYEKSEDGYIRIFKYIYKNINGKSLVEWQLSNK